MSHAQPTPFSASPPEQYPVPAGAPHAGTPAFLSLTIELDDALGYEGALPFLSGALLVAEH